MTDQARYDGSRPEPVYDTLLPPMRESELDELLAAERERCAKIAEDVATANLNDGPGEEATATSSVAQAIANKIRELHCG